MDCAHLKIIIIIPAMHDLLVELVLGVNVNLHWQHSGRKASLTVTPWQPRLATCNNLIRRSQWRWFNVLRCWVYDIYKPNGDVEWTEGVQCDWRSDGAQCDCRSVCLEGRLLTFSSSESFSGAVWTVLWSPIWTAMFSPCGQQQTHDVIERWWMVSLPIFQYLLFSVRFYICTWRDQLYRFTDGCYKV